MENVFKFPVINPLLHNELRLKIMVALDSLESADFMYLCQITDSTRGNLSVQITTLKEAGYLEVTKTGLGRFSHTVCRITSKGREALHAYEDGLVRLFSQQVPVQDNKQSKAG
jgi:DNA-binding transcriptional ArsR family regulator